MIAKSICLLLSMAALSVAVPRRTPNTSAPAPVAIGPAAPAPLPHRIQFLYASAAWGSEVAQRKPGKLVESDTRSNANSHKRIAAGKLRH